MTNWNCNVDKYNKIALFILHLFHNDRTICVLGKIRGKMTGAPDSTSGAGPFDWTAPHRRQAPRPECCSCAAPEPCSSNQTHDV